MSVIQLRIPSQALAKYSKEDKITITGNFDNWEHTKFVLDYNAEDNCFGVKITDISTKTIIFKFLINDKEWVTLPYFETEMDGMGFVNNVLNSQELNIAGLEDHLDEITISSGVGYEPQQVEPRKENGGSVDNDYIHISSQDELSSTEDVQLEAVCSDLADLGSVDAPLGQSNSPTIVPANRLQTLVTVVKKGQDVLEWVELR